MVNLSGIGISPNTSSAYGKKTEQHKNSFTYRLGFMIEGKKQLGYGFGLNLRRNEKTAYVSQESISRENQALMRSSYIEEYVTDFRNDSVHVLSNDWLIGVSVQYQNIEVGQDLTPSRSVLVVGSGVCAMTSIMSTRSA